MAGKNATGDARTPPGTRPAGPLGTAPPLVSGALPVIGHAPQFLRDQLGLLERGYVEHGEIFRLRLGVRPAVFLLGPDLARWVFRETDHGLDIGPSLAFTRHLFGPDFYFLAPREEYLHQREIMLPLFRGRMMTSYLDIMERHCAELIGKLGDAGTFDLPKEMNDLALGVIMESFLGAGFIAHMPASVADDFRDLMRGLDPIVPPWVPAPHHVRARRARDRLRGAVAALIEARRDQPADSPDFLQVLMSAQALDGTPVTRQWVVQVALGVAFAGHDSTTGHLSWAVADLLQHPEELDKVLAEQRRILEGEQLDLSAIHRMAALDRALRETARLHAVAPIMLRRSLRPLEVAGFVIPAGADVFVAPVASHRLATLFEAPDSYVPDRYLADPKLVAHLHGFGGGSHRCLGEHFAWLLAQVAVTRLLKHFDLELRDRPETVPTPALKGVRSPCRVQYRRRASGAPVSRP
jgi:sterol 14alpha-demethylase